MAVATGQKGVATQKTPSQAGKWASQPENKASQVAKRSSQPENGRRKSSEGRRNPANARRRGESSIAATPSYLTYCFNTLPNRAIPLRIFSSLALPKLMRISLSGLARDG